MNTQETKSKRNYELRNILPQEKSQLIALEHACFPPAQAMPPSCMEELMRVAGDFNLVAIDKETDQIAASLFGLATNEERFRDAFFTNAALHNPDGKNVMLLSLEVWPAYRGCGLARLLMERYLEIEKNRNKHKIFLTCLAEKIGMYERMGFTDCGLSASVLGGETWHDMQIDLHANRFTCK